jgi:hypothetical protein
MKQNPANPATPTTNTMPLDKDVDPFPDPKDSSRKRSFLNFMPPVNPDSQSEHKTNACGDRDETRDHSPTGLGQMPSEIPDDEEGFVKATEILLASIQARKSRLGSVGPTASQKQRSDGKFRKNM